ncbi:MAG: GNAT family N-acetyltransferase, partial [Cyclobacteriaceae bacterium]
NQNKLAVLLFNHQYQVHHAELGACLSISNTTFIDVIDSWERRKLKQSWKSNLSFKIIPRSQLNEIFNFILACREERGHSLSMTFKELNATVKKLQNHFVLFGVYHSSDLIAASIAIKVNKKVLYNFYSAHSKASDKLSPVVFLIGEMYDWCAKHSFELLDLGTSAWGGKPNFPLIDFKLRLGAAPTMKLTFEKMLA